MIWSNKFDTDWERNYTAAKEYYDKYGNLDIPSTYVSNDNLAVGSWIRNHRAQPGKDPQIKITDERRAKLDAIGMLWDTGDSWEIRYELAKKYYETHGNLDIAQTYVTENNIWLGKWINMQNRIRIGSIKGQKLTAEQEAKLEAIGIDWLTVPERLWNEYYSAAEAYYRENGHLILPKSYIGENGKALRNWIYLQRKRRGESKLSDSQIEKLTAIGMIWEKQSDIWEEKWEENYALLANYVKNNGTANVPVGYVTPSGIRLGKWLSFQKKNITEQ